MCDHERDTFQQACYLAGAFAPSPRSEAALVHSTGSPLEFPELHVLVLEPALVPKMMPPPPGCHNNH